MHYIELRIILSCDLVRFILTYIKAMFLCFQWEAIDWLLVKATVGSRGWPEDTDPTFVVRTTEEIVSSPVPYQEKYQENIKKTVAFRETGSCICDVVGQVRSALVKTTEVSVAKSVGEEAGEKEEKEEEE